LQVAGASEAVLPLAHDLYAYEPVGEERDIGRVFEQLQLEQIVRIGIEAFSLDSTSVKVHPDGTGAFKKNGPQAIGNPAADGTQRFISYGCRGCSNGYSVRAVSRP